ncbi:MAG: MFS transporter, partial [Propionicimonas sp.]
MCTFTFRARSLCTPAGRTPAELEFPASSATFSATTEHRSSPRGRQSHQNPENSDTRSDPSLCVCPVLFFCARKRARVRHPPHHHHEGVAVSKARRLTSFIVLSMTGGIVFQVAYIRFVFLSETAHALDLSIQRYGEITSVFGAVAVVMYFCGGWFADRFSPKALIVVAMTGMGAVDLWLATVPSDGGILVAHVLMAVLGMGLYWSSLVKLVSMLGTADQQGKLFGFLEGVRGVTSTVAGVVAAGVVA